MLKLWPFDRRPGRKSKLGAASQPPRLLSFLGLHLATGLAIGVFVASLMIYSNLAGLKDLLVEADEPFVPIFLLYAFNALTFGSVSMGIGIMTLPYDGTCDMRDRNDRDGTGPLR